MASTEYPESALTSEWIDTDRTDRTVSPFSVNGSVWEDGQTLISDQLSTHRTVLTDMVSLSPGRDRIMPDRDSFYVEEEERWMELNRELRQMGFGAVEFASCSDTPRDPGVFLTREQTASLRDTVDGLLADVRRRRALVKELVQANSQLKEELKNTAALSQRFENKAHDLKCLLESASVRIEELQEDRHLLERSTNAENQKLRGTKHVATQKSKALERRCKNLEEELSRSRARVSKLEQGEAERAARTAEVFRRVKHRAPAGSANGKGYDPLDNKLLDVIDAYERQVSALHREMNFLHSLGGKSSDHEDKSPKKEVKVNPAVEASLRDLVQELRCQLSDAASRNAELEEAAELVKLELQSRPAVKDYRNLIFKLKKAESTLKKHGISNGSGSERSDGKYSTKVEDLEYLPLCHCRDLLQQTCLAAQVDDLADLPAAVERMCNLVNGELTELRRLHSDVLRIINSSCAPGTSAETDESDVVSRLEMWLDQLSALPELRAAVLSLANVAFPWRPPLEFPVDRDDMWHVVGALEALTESVSTIDKSHAHLQVETAPASTLAALVEHFQRLFEVPRLTGVYPRMTELYQHLGETQNSLAALRGVLGLPSSASAGALVEAVTTVVRSAQMSMAEQLKGFLRPEDIEPLLERMQEYDEFFPVFHALVRQLQEILSLQRVDHIVPAVKNLKLLADSKHLY